MPIDPLDRIWQAVNSMQGTMLEVVAKVGVLDGKCDSLAVLLKETRDYQKEQNGNVVGVLMRLEAIELANAADCGEKIGARRQWLIIGGVLSAGAALAAIGGFIGYLFG